MYHISFRRVLFYFIFVNPIIMAAVMFPGLLAGAIATVDNTTAALQTLVFCYFLGGPPVVVIGDSRALMVIVLTHYKVYY